MITNLLQSVKSFSIQKRTQKKELAANRSSFLDAYRGLAVFLMIVFHFCWDLRAFGYLKYSLQDPFWVSFRGIIMTLFITAIGWSAYLSYRTGIRWPSFFYRHGKLLLCAASISVATYIAFPNNWIFFGILHFIFLCSLVIIPVARHPLLSTLIGTLLLGLYFLNDTVGSFNLHQYLTSTFHFPSYTLDFVHILPWLAVLFFGPLLGFIQLHKVSVPSYPPFSLLAFLGRHALLIYLLHQVVLYGAVALTNFILVQFI